VNSAKQCLKEFFLDRMRGYLKFYLLKPVSTTWAWIHIIFLSLLNLGHS
jgi:hypothetical protein